MPNRHTYFSYIGNLAIEKSARNRKQTNIYIYIYISQINTYAAKKHTNRNLRGVGHIYLHDKLSWDVKIVRVLSISWEDKGQDVPGRLGGLPPQLETKLQQNLLHQFVDRMCSKTFN